MSEWLTCRCGLTIVGGVREAWFDWRRGRAKTVCARVAWPAWVPGPSTSPLGRSRSMPTVDAFARFHRLIKKGDLPAIRKLVTSGVDANLRNRFGWTPSLLNGRAGISPEMAVRLSIAFGTSSESWMNQQTQYDLWHAEKRRKDLRVSRVAASRTIPIG